MEPVCTWVTLLSLVGLLLGASGSLRVPSSDGVSLNQSVSEKRAAAAESFFRALDDNGDGQIEQAEALAYVSASLNRDENLDTAEEVSAAVAGMMDGLDGADTDSAISLDELTKHTERLLKGHRVADWVSHGLLLPQYAEAFRRNGITALDFPLLVGASGARILEEDLEVASGLHVEKIIRGIKWQMLGLGAPPAAPLDLACTPFPCSGIMVQWSPPPLPGKPGLHKYVLERRAELGGSWEVVAEPDDDDTSFFVPDLEAGSHQFRLAAWNSVGRSPRAVSAACRLPACEDSPSLRHQAAATGDSSRWSFYVWLNTALSVVVYGSAILLKHAVQSPGFAAKCRTTAMSCLSALSGGRAGSRREGSPAGTGGSARTPPQRGGGSCSQGHEKKAGNAASAAPPALAPAEASPEPRQDVGPLSPSTYPEGYPRELVASPLQSPPGSRDLGDTAVPSALPACSHRRSSSSGGGLNDGGRPSQPPGAPHDKDGLEALRGSNSSSQMPFSSSASRLDRLFEGDEGEPSLGLSSFPSAEHKHRCAHPGCGSTWERWHSLKDLRRHAQSHYCGSCQRTFCRKHTRISPHGALGSCGLESNCYCVTCFSHMPPELQERLEQTNRLGKPGSRRSLRSQAHGWGPAAANSSIASSECSGGAETDSCLQELDSHLSQVRSEANWAKARMAVGKFLQRDRPGGEGRQMPIRQGSPLGEDHRAAGSRGNVQQQMAANGPSPLHRPTHNFQLLSRNS
uniref:Calmodulin n=2 Tax=Tetraselmis sp. GSL018 TaxID=582737 RepID=A0A061SCX3_9CHLO